MTGTTEDGGRVRLTLGEVEALARETLLANGCDIATAEAVAATMTAAERDGAESHGLFRLPGHVKLLASGIANGRAEPRLERAAPSVLRVEGDLGFAPRAHAVGLSPLAELARQQGLAALAVRRCVHFAALWPETEWLAERGLAALALTSSPPYVAAPGGATPVFGTNPISFAWPRPGAEPMVWDMATAATARGEVQIHARDGKPMPEGAGVDAGGRPTTDPHAILEGGAQLPFGGYKGAAIALMVDLLAGPLMDEVTSLEAGASAAVGGPQPGGELILAFSPERFGGPQGSARAEGLFAALAAQESVRIPGDRRRARRARIAAEGVRVDGALHAEILGLRDSPQSG